ncbi:hypothetical protein [uncultured Roseovarius sp.]|uniref:hypothetical protein n=1 Tax=uncultured Roseovarius sp. TaxID=293344 RepID=UPI00262ECA9E|nr:hypothetical protein [uncultured Roseovarius sp.]
MADQTDIPKATLDAATTRDALPQGQLTLLGTLHGPDGARALLRIGAAEVHRVEVGTQIGRATVAAIGEGVMILTRGGRSERLTLPGI